MSADRALLQAALSRGEQEGGSVEFKERLTRELHLSGGRRESLAAQLKHRILSGDGEAMYVVGVTDAGGIAGISQSAFSETMDVLSLLAEEAGAHIEDVETWGTDDDGLVGVATIADGGALDVADDHLIVGTAGHVDHGKSTLVGSLVTGSPDDGEGGLRSYLDVQPHEVERGLSADLSYGVYGFDEDGPIHVDDPDRKSDRAAVVEEADRVVSFVDTVGHEPWLSTTIRGLVGQKLDYGLLTVAADDGPTATTREHLGVLLATESPTVVAITKTDLVADDRVDAVEREIERLLRNADRSPLPVSRHGVEAAIEEIGNSVVPIVRTSAVTREGLPVLDTLFERLPKTATADGDFELYVDRSYEVTGVGAVASGTVKSGTVDVGDHLYLGPFPDGSYRDVEVRSIEMHYHRVDHAEAGRIVGIALKGVRAADVERGMVLLSQEADPTPVRAFEADVMVLNHPTRIQAGYEPVVHLETVSEAARFDPEGGQLLPGDRGTTRVRFKFRPYHVQEGQRFVFREGRSKGVGTVTNLLE
ncbi:GTPBP1 family GTP-binding protein [Halanaeroarchaeum sulfurireducens]|uniref:GTP-binding protein n=1 Tax=Halanaeroarchaeum sulfurireducens TaxID=1604004 RepID=A0A0F7PG58_9EURY|nr:GTPBP1 family GTP-binding protein [Halanaeroarchaeum sulfurireducens]AKH98278.1 GTP-binding protein [Halanaeroarchaeum sulfurireducens]ALG82672.1 GTP-binding protein [Halanaeroarchaeum sulfurireducens]